MPSTESCAIIWIMNVLAQRWDEIIQSKGKTDLASLSHYYPVIFRGFIDIAQISRNHCARNGEKRLWRRESSASETKWHSQVTGESILLTKNAENNPQRPLRWKRANEDLTEIRSIVANRTRAFFKFGNLVRISSHSRHPHRSSVPGLR